MTKLGDAALGVIDREINDLEVEMRGAQAQMSLLEEMKHRLLCMRSRMEGALRAAGESK